MSEKLAPFLAFLAVLSVGYPLYCAGRLERKTSLRHTVNWAIAAWAAWLATPLAELLERSSPVLHHLALSFLACTVVAVLGARFPGMAAWNFVVCGLLAVLTLPLLQQGWNAPGWRMEAVWAGLLGVILAVGVLNYPPSTGIGFVAIGLGFLSAFELCSLVRVDNIQGREQGLAMLSILAAAFAWGCFGFFRRTAEELSAFDSTWRHFRNRYGRVWAWRVRDQFNNAAFHNGWKVRLTWRGLEVEPGQTRPTEVETGETLRTLQAALKRFGLEDTQPL